MAFLAIIVFGLTLTAGLFYWKFDWRVTAFFLGSGIPHKAPWLPAIGEFGRPLTPFWLLLLWAWAAKRPRVLVAGLLAMLLTTCAVLPIKSAVGRVRPDEMPDEVMQQPFYKRSYSFPSGDATLAFAVATAAAGFIAAKKVRWLPFLLAAMAGVTRLILLRHFASDVIAGAALGILCGYAALRISRSRFVRGILSRAPPTCWRPAFGVATLLFLIFDAVTRGPVTKNFLPIFWPAVAFVLVASKGEACLRRAGLADSPVPQSVAMRTTWAVFYFVLGAAFCVMILIIPISMPEVFLKWPKWLWFLPGVGVAIMGGYWSAHAMWRGKAYRAFVRITAAIILSWGLVWRACLLMNGL